MDKYTAKISTPESYSLTLGFEVMCFINDEFADRFVCGDRAQAEDVAADWESRTSNDYHDVWDGWKSAE
jgi:hypothetical protein